jgi:hypothetical protein
MNYTTDLMEHIANEVGVSKDAKYAFMTGYMSGIIEDMILRYPEARAVLETHARRYKYEGS